MDLDKRIKAADPAKGRNLPDQDQTWNNIQVAITNSRLARSRVRSIAWATSGLAFATVAVLTVMSVTAQGPRLHSNNTNYALSSPAPAHSLVPGSNTAGPASPSGTAETAFAAAAQVTGAENFLATAAPKPSLEPIIVGTPDYAMSVYQSWQSALGAISYLAGPALISHDIAFKPSARLKRAKATDRTVYKVTPTQDAKSLAMLLKRAFGIKAPLKVEAELDRNRSTTITAGHIDKATGGVHHGLAVLVGPTQAQWSYGDSGAVAWRLCHKGDKQGQPSISIIERGTDAKGARTCRVLPRDLGPTKKEALTTAKAIFRQLGFESTTDLKAAKNGQLWISTAQLGTQAKYRYDVFAVSGYLMVAGKPTTLAQTITFSASSKRIWSATGFQGSAKAVGRYPTVTPRFGVGRISEFDNGPMSAKHIDLKNPYSWYYSNLSSSIAKAPNLQYDGKSGNLHRVTGRTKLIYATGLHTFPAVVEDHRGVTWIVPAYEYRDHNGYLGSVIALTESEFIKGLNPKF